MSDGQLQGKTATGMVIDEWPAAEPMDPAKWERGPWIDMAAPGADRTCTVPLTRIEYDTITMRVAPADLVRQEFYTIRERRGKSIWMGPGLPALMRESQQLRDYLSDPAPRPLLFKLLDYWRNGAVQPGQYLIQTDAKPVIRKPGWVFSGRVDCLYPDQIKAWANG